MPSATLTPTALVNEAYLKLVSGAQMALHDRGHFFALAARAMRQLGLSARAYHRVLRVARSIADLAASGPLRAEHVAEAITLRQLDRRAASGIGQE